MADAERHPLKHPVEYEGETIEFVSLRRPRVRDLRALEAKKGEGDIAQSIAMIAAVTGMPEGVVDEMDAEDYTILSERIADFFPRG